VRPDTKRTVERKIGMSLPILMVIVYGVATIAISLVYSRKQQSLETYFVAERNLPLGLVAMLLFGELVAGSSTVGNAATAFNNGISSVWGSWGVGAGCIIFVVFVSKTLFNLGAEKGCMSLAEAYAHLFDDRSRMVMMVTTVVVYFIIFSTQAPAAAAILSPLLGIDYSVAVWIFAAVFIGVTIFGGLQGVANMNILNTFVMIAGMVIVAVKSISSLGGVSSIQASLPANFFNIGYPNIWTVLAQGLGSALGCIVAATVTSACFSAKSHKVANRGILLAGIVVIPFALLPSLIGMSARIVAPDIHSNTALYEMANHLGPIFGGIISIACLAAIMDSSGLLLIVTTTITRDFYKHLLFPKATDRQQLVFSKIAAIVVGVTATWFGMNASSILGQVLGAFQIRSIAGIVLLAKIIWPSVSKDAAFYSMFMGGLIAMVWHFAGNPFGTQPLWPGAAVCLTILIPMTLFGKNKHDK